jgi:hypothetical protein
MALGLPEYEQNAHTYETVIAKIEIIGNTVQASIKTYCSNISSVQVYHEDDGKSLTAVDAGSGFTAGDLDNDAPPATIDVLVPVGNAREIVSVVVPAQSIFNVGLSAPMTAGVVTLRGTSSTGVTPSGNIALGLSLTGLNIDEDDVTTPNCTFFIEVRYLKTQPRN